MTTQPERWSEALRQATREALTEFAFAPNEGVVGFKHVGSGSGTIAVSDLLRGRLRMVDRETKQETTFADADELMDAGWAID